LIQERRSSSPAKESPSLRWTAIIVDNLVILLINATSPRRTSSRARKMMTVMMRRSRRNSSRGRKASTNDSIRKMEKHILLVTSSLTLNPQVGLLQVKKRMMKRLPPSQGISLHHHHHLHPLLTYASWLKANGRYNLRMILLIIVILMMSMLRLPMMN
jgi:hypothetical protein